MALRLRLITRPPIPTAPGLISWGFFNTMSEVNVQSSPNPENPNEKILGKFTSQDELVTAYRELEKKLGGGFAQTPEEQQNETPTDAQPPAPEKTGGSPEAQKQTTGDTADTDSPYGEAILTALSASGLDANAVSDEFYSESGLSPETRGKLDATFGKQAVDLYFQGLQAADQGQQAEADQAIQGIVSTIGGEENWNTIAQWAAGPNGDQDLAQSFNAAADRGDVGAMKAAAIALKSIYESKNGSLGASSVTRGVPPSAGAATGFRSTAELTQAMSDPRYATDAAYRADVERRLGVTEGFNVR